MKSNKIWSVFLLAPLAACSGGEDKAVQACETVFAAVNAALVPEERVEKVKLEKKGIQIDKVHLFVSSPNGLGETVYTDFYCSFRLDRSPTEKEATLKLSDLTIDGDARPLSSWDLEMKKRDKKTATEWLEEKKLGAILPAETELEFKQ